MIGTSMLLPAGLLSLAMVTGPVLAAQGPASPSACTYATCALRIEPTLWGEVLVRGERGERVSRVGAYGTGVDVLLAGPDSAAAHAREYVSSTQRAAVIGGLGAVALSVGMVHRAHRGASDVSAGDAVAIVAGTAAVLVAAPFAMKARRELTRAIWWFNAALAH